MREYERVSVSNSRSHLFSIRVYLGRNAIKNRLFSCHWKDDDRLWIKYAQFPMRRILLFSLKAKNGFQRERMNTRKLFLCSLVFYFLPSLIYISIYLMTKAAYIEQERETQRERERTSDREERARTQIQFSSIIGLNISIDAILNYISQAFT